MPSLQLKIDCTCFRINLNSQCFVSTDDLIEAEVLAANEHSLPHLSGFPAEIGTSASHSQQNAAEHTAGTEQW